ncbi:MAG: diguanylate cyclase [Planctomycetaceae bacterium]|nr:diguanylate cyclase [Planctomycetaceae bacterium]
MVFETRQIWTSSQLPTLSVLGMKVLELSRRSDVDPRELVELLRVDATFSHRVITVANSALFQHLSPDQAAIPLETVQQAVEKLGTAVITSLTLTLAVGDACLTGGHPHGLSANLWHQAIVKAVAAEIFCSQVREGLECEFFLAGLLLDIGRFALLRTAPQSYVAVLEKSKHELLPLWRTEQTELGLTSAQVGGQLIEQWGFPARLVHAIQVQFAPLTTFEQMSPSTECPLCSALALASAIGDYFCSDHQALSWFRIRELTRDTIPLTEAELDDTLRRIAKRFTAIARALSATAELPDVASLKSKALEQLKLISQRLAATHPEEHAPAVRKGPEQRGTSTESAATGPKAFRDPLTLVFTREFFEDTLHKEVQRCRQLSAPVGVAFVDIDRFAELNSQHGEAFGEVVLKRVGGLLKDLLRSSDTIARCDHQFAILACDPTAKGMQRLADRIRGRIAGERLIWAGQPVPLTVCVGATLALPARHDQDLAPTIVAAASKAVEEAAVAGGNHIYFDSLVNEVELQRLFMINQFRFSRWLIAQGVLDIPRVGKALIDFKPLRVRLGELALRQELLSPQEIEQVLDEQEETQDRFGTIAVRRDFLSEDQLVGLLILQQEDPLQAAEQFLCKGVLDQQRLQTLLKEYFHLLPWAAPLSPSAERG